MLAFLMFSEGSKRNIGKKRVKLDFFFLSFGERNKQANHHSNGFIPNVAIMQLFDLHSQSDGCFLHEIYNALKQVEILLKKQLILLLLSISIPHPLKDPLTFGCQKNNTSHCCLRLQPKSTEIGENFRKFMKKCCHKTSPPAMSQVT